MSPKNLTNFSCESVNEVGFISHDIRVYLVGTLSSIFASELEAQKRSAKTHEYILVMRKPQDLSLVDFEKKEKTKTKVLEEAEESVYEEPKDIRYVDRKSLSEQGTEDSLNFYRKK